VATKTLNDLFDSLDWAGVEEDLTDKSKQALLDCAMYMQSCAKEDCNWKGVRLDTGDPYTSCPYCDGALKSDEEARRVFRDRLLGVWPQVVSWMSSQGLATQGLDKR
jgi:nicotinic acid phosphoribosyltransferase